VPHCKSCPGKPAIVAKLRLLDWLSENDDIGFKQWQAADQISLNTITLPTD